MAVVSSSLALAARMSRWDEAQRDRFDSMSAAAARFAMDYEHNPIPIDQALFAFLVEWIDAEAET